MDFPSISHERDFYYAGHTLIAGIDEVGRGALAGCVMVGAVVLPIADPIVCTVLRAAGVRDSKQLSAAQRKALVPLIRDIALGVAVGEASAAEIDAIGIVPACRLAARRALAALPCNPTALVLDAFPLPDDPRPQRAIIRGDQISLSIAAAAIVAKVTRDAQMVALHTDHPGYGFASHKGYAAPTHLKAIDQLGASPIHRITWKPFVQPPLFTVEPNGKRKAESGFG
jgi:ribonuclease HII